MSRKETGLRTVSSLRFFTECVNGRHHFFLTGLSITRAIQTLAPEDEKVPGTISRRVAGSWFIWSFWLISSVWFFWFIWFDERERQDRPAHQIDCL